MGGGDERHDEIDGEADLESVEHSAHAGPLPQWNPQQEQREAGDDDDGAHRQAGVARHALVEHVPWGGTEVGFEDEADAHAEQAEAG